MSSVATSDQLTPGADSQSHCSCAPTGFAASAAAAADVGVPAELGTGDLSPALAAHPVAEQEPLQGQPQGQIAMQHFIKTCQAQRWKARLPPA